jgi:hypothetical protein
MDPVGSKWIREPWNKIDGGVRCWNRSLSPKAVHLQVLFLLGAREEHRLRVFENRVLRRISGPKRYEVTEGGRNCIMRNFISCTHLQV